MSFGGQRADWIVDEVKVVTNFLLATWLMLNTDTPLERMLIANYQTGEFGFGLTVNGFKVFGGYSRERGGRLMVYDYTYRIWLRTGTWISCGDSPKARK